MPPLGAGCGSQESGSSGDPFSERVPPADSPSYWRGASGAASGGRDTQDQDLVGLELKGMKEPEEERESVG